ncbi:MAG: hypothetical protein RLZZ28_172 [Bacteroidota bacterium]|jgi:hypothetical protein
MRKNPKKRYLTLLLLFGTCILYRAEGQFSLNGQLRTRTEIRNGLGNLVAVDSKPAAFTSQRTRLSFGYKWDRLSFGATIQDVRVWGQDASSISNADGNKLMLHEGWADLTLANKADTAIKFHLLDLLSLKIGRQELIYDDARLIGNLDWLQQARHHDMALLKALHHGWQVDLGYAYNQNSDGFGLTGTSYVPGNLPAYMKNSIGILVPVPAGIVPLAASGNMANNSIVSGTPVYVNPPGTNAATQNYQSFTSVYISKKFKQTKISALFFNDNFGKYRLDSVGSNLDGYIYGRRFVKSGTADLFDYSGSNHRFTYGLMVNHTVDLAAGFGRIALQAAYYSQTGRDRDGNALEAYHYTLAATYQKGRFSFTPGYDLLSGNDASSPSGKNNRFDPLYGTPHKFWGYMDYFYAGTGSAAGGLSNTYFKLKYAANRLTVGTDLHLFSLNKDMKRADGTVIDKKLGTEIDWQLSYAMNKFTNIELGYSLMLATNSMPYAKSQASTEAVANTYNKTGTWFYAMFKFSPDFIYGNNTLAGNKKN